MPEGHLIHWLARRHRGLLVGVRVAATSPQGRFAAGAARLDDARLEDVDAYGKHLLYRWDSPALLHVHLGQQGKFLERDPPRPPPPQARLALTAERLGVDLIAPATCELLDGEGRGALLARLGPDPLRDDADPEPAWQRIRTSRRSIGALLLDQTVIAGVGNVLRAESLNIAGIHPDVAGERLGRERFERLWGTLVEVMRAGAEEGRVLTVPGAADEGAGRFVYRQEACRRCGAPVESGDLAGRTVYACPRCQPRPRATRP